jgi:hypothetical protein
VSSRYQQGCPLALSTGPCRTLTLTREQRDRESAEMLVRGNVLSLVGRTVPRSAGHMVDCKCCGKTFRVIHHKQVVCSEACRKRWDRVRSGNRPGRSTLGRPFKALDLREVLASTSYTVPEATQFIATVDALRAACLAQYGGIYPCEKALGLRRGAIAALCQPDPGLQRVKQRRLESLAARIGVTHSIPMAYYDRDNRLKDNQAEAAS